MLRVRISKSALIFAFVMLSAADIRGAEPMTQRAAREIIDSRGADPLGGIWRMGPDGATIAILPVAASQGRFEIYLLDSPDMSVIPGGKIGSAVSTGVNGTYDAEFAGAGKLTAKRQRFIITLSADGNLNFRSYKKGKKISLGRWLPYLYRVSVSDYNTRPTSVDGAIRVYPRGNYSGPTLL
ncbi:MAG: hypothetical protein K2J12_05500 [Muribaculaceae bacterium]|nr:hypothetical protein [Muribaculaceae bacterium]